MTLRFTKDMRQRIVDEYLVATGRDIYVPSEFVSWLETQPNHEAHGWFFAVSDEDAAQLYRLKLAREFVSGLRITVAYSTTPINPTITSTIRVREVEVPAVISPRVSRSTGGGYVPMDLDDPFIKQELHEQAAQDLRAWLKRYRGVCTMSDIDPISIEDIAVQIEQAGVSVPA